MRNDIPAVAMSNALNAVGYRAGYWSTLSDSEVTAFAAALSFINDPTSIEVYSRGYVAHFYGLVQATCARINTNTLTAMANKIADGVTLGRARGGPSPEFRAMHHLALLLKALRARAADDDDDEGGINACTGGYCEGVLREWHTKCVVAWVAQTGLSVEKSYRSTSLVPYGAQTATALSTSSELGLVELSQGVAYYGAGAAALATATTAVAAGLARGMFKAGTQRRLEASTISLFTANYEVDDDGEWWDPRAMPDVDIPDHALPYQDELRVKGLLV
jgi:hypothetical protein